MILLASSHAAAAELRAQRDGVVDYIDLRSPGVGSDSQGGLVWQTEIRRIGSQYVRLRIANIAGNASGAILTLRDANGREVRRYEVSELAERAPLWTAIIPGGYVLVSLQSPEPSVRFSLTIDQIAYQAYAGAPLSTVGDDEKEPVANYPSDATLKAVEGAVAKLSFIEAGTPKVCTGFLIESGEFVTNHHCINSPATCSTAVAIFGYQHDESGLLHFGRQYECERLVEERSSYPLDIAVLKLRGGPDTEWGRLRVKASDPKVGSPLFIIQHPAGQPKQVSKKNCVIDAVPVDGRDRETDFTHSCDTAGGSSGAPVFNELGEVVGLHHYGFNDGGLWTENRAVRMQRIVELLNR
jgi:V8-like Glu-specific endopeptidase